MNVSAMKSIDLTAGPVPLYHRLYLVLRQQIEEGRFAPQQPLPGENEISRQHGVSRITVRRTMDLLAADGLVDRRRGRGTFVRSASGAPARQQPLSGLADNLSSYARHTTVMVHDFEYLPVEPDIARAMRIAPGTMVQKIVRTRHRRGEPVSLLVTHVPEDLGRTFSREEIAAGSLIRLLERAGAQVVSAEITITARVADTWSAALLAVPVGQPLIAQLRTVSDPTGRVIEHIASWYRPDQYEVRLSLSREGVNSPNLWRFKSELSGGEAENPA